MSLRSMTTIKDTLHILDDVCLDIYKKQTMGHFKLVEWNAILVKLLNVYFTCTILHGGFMIETLPGQ